MGKDAGDAAQQCLTPPENAAIIAALFAVEAREKRLARQVVGLQAVAALITAGIACSLNGTPQDAIAVLSGGLISVLNGALLTWRMSRAALPSAHEAHHPSSAHHQLRLMYFYAAERFLVVVVLLGLSLAALRLSPLAVLGGFVMGQAVLLAARLFLNRFNQNLDLR
ncbi:MAG TPA: ATP synthase subunit I [Gallionella sp.]|nr:ATP synthase subunit I [Gallionella sp.]